MIQDSKIDENGKISYRLYPYSYATVICRQLEILIGKDFLEDMFFKDGFNRLKDLLMMYKSEKEVLDFFRNCDAACLCSFYKNSKFLNKRTLKAQNFIIDICNKHFPQKKFELFDELLFAMIIAQEL